MNGYRRSCMALLHEEPDRVPFFEMHVSPPVGRRILASTPLTYNTPLQLDLAADRKLETKGANDIIVEELASYIEKVKLDFVRTPGLISKNAKVEKLSENRWLIGGSVHVWRGGTLWNEELRRRRIDLNTFVDYWESLRNSGVHEETFSVLRAVVRRFGGEVFITYDSDGSWGPIVSDQPLLIEVLKAMYTDPDLVETLIVAMSERAIEIGKAAIDEGANGILMCVDYGYSNGLWMPPRFFRRFVKPALKRQCEAFKRRGGFALLHSDGNIAAVLDDLVEVGVDAYQGIDVEAGMDLSEVKRRIGEKVCLIGNVSPVILEHGSTEDVRREVSRCLSAGAPGGGYVLSASANISVCKHAEGFLEMARLLSERGKYAHC